MNTLTASTKRAGLLGLSGGAIAAVGAATIFVATDQSDGPETLVRGGTSATAFVLTEPIWTITHVLVLLCFLGLRRSGLTGDSRAARIGMGLTLAGLGLLVPAEFATTFVGNQLADGAAMSTIGPIFGLASVLLTIGLLTVGVTTLSTGHWAGWERFTPLAAGLCGLPLTALGPTSLFLLGITLWSLAMAAVGLAMIRRPEANAATAAAPIGEATATHGPSAVPTTANAAG